MSDYCGFWRLSHEHLAAVLARTDLCWELVRVYLALADLTLGYGKEQDVVSLGQISNHSNVSRPNTVRSLKQLKALGLYNQSEITRQKVIRWVTWPPPVVNSDSTCVVSRENRSVVKGVVRVDTHQDIQEKEKKKCLSERDLFDQARKAYPGVKRGLDTELKDFKKKHQGKSQSYAEILPLLLPAIKSQIQSRAAQEQAGQWIPPWKHFKTWLSQRCWEIEVDSVESKANNQFGTHLATEEDLKRLEEADAA